MNKKIIIHIILFIIIQVLINMLIFIAFIPFVKANSTYEDFTTYTELDNNNHINLVGTDHIDFDAYRNEDAWLYDDKGVGHFTTFEHWIDAEITEAIHVSDVFLFYILSNGVDNFHNLRGNDEDFISINFQNVADSLRIYFGVGNSGGDTFDYFAGFTINIPYYFVISRDATNNKCEIYSSVALRIAGGGGDVDTLIVPIATRDAGDLRYVFAANTYNSTIVYSVEGDIENLDLKEGIPDNPPYYSNIGDNGVTQVGEMVTCSSYWEDDFELDTCYIEHNATETLTNYSISVSGSSSWANKTFQLAFTKNVKVAYKFWCSDNASQWNSTGYSYITTTQLYITFNLNNSTQGRFYIDLVNTANNTQNGYNYNQSIFLLGATYNSSYVWCNFTYSETIITENFNNYLTNGNDTVWCNFDMANITANGNGNGEYTETDLHEYFILGALISSVCVSIIMVIIIDKKDLIRGK